MPPARHLRPSPWRQPPGPAAVPLSGVGSYNKNLLDKVLEMADGIEVENLPFTTRSELMKKHQS